ncbi:hypothetical protein BCR32DRAFT_297527 [Anaeromyces robustus]|uniref:Transglutaminase-like domain-containing protein n=1 Tax=Anaeromyces robustus TaxID=1754192 RepID=A0A1Y1W3I2_9FUNG|nr:hypothetical protein BCR32DRAFT_297527 [Anaeromyces robustus]|eukprot:ORX67714.1 hypothetical protein BCR32DRAFT_297527 [Anaeromyces robustus]
MKIYLLYIVSFILLYSKNLSWALEFKKRNTILEYEYVEPDVDYEYKNKNDTLLISEKIPIKYWENKIKEELKNDGDSELYISSVENSDFSFYGQLSSDEKQIYDIIYSCSKKSQPDLNIKISISGIRDIDSFVEELYEISERVFTVLIYENPELWWIGTYQLGLSSTLILYKYVLTYNLTPSSTIFEDYSKKDIERLNTEIEGVKNDIVSRINNLNLTTPYAILRYIHDYLITNIIYVLDESRDHIRTVYGALVEQRCVCEGYAEAFQYIAKQFNINVIIARSAEHEWNFAELDGKWYVVDVTFDDPGKETPLGSNKNLQTSYFLIGTSQVIRGERYSDDPDHYLVYSGYSDEHMVDYPQLSSTSYVPTDKELEELETVQVANMTSSDIAYIHDSNYHSEKESNDSNSIFNFSLINLLIIAMAVQIFI